MDILPSIEDRISMAVNSKKHHPSRAQIHTHLRQTVLDLITSNWSPTKAIMHDLETVERTLTRHVMKCLSQRKEAVEALATKIEERMGAKIRGEYSPALLWLLMAVCGPLEQVRALLSGDN